MRPVFGHGRLRLYLLKLLAEAPRHGYEIIRLLSERFDGHYAPSAGTVYPRLAKLEAEGLVSHTTKGGRKVYAITSAGHAELSARYGELTALEEEIAESLAALAADIQQDVSGSARSLRDELQQEADTARSASGDRQQATDSGAWRASGAWWKGQHAKERAEHAAEHAKAQAERAARGVREGMGYAEAPAAWASALAESMEELGRGLADMGRNVTEAWHATEDASGADTTSPHPPHEDHKPGTTGDRRHEPGRSAGDAPHPPHADDPARELARLLDQFRDEIRDAARDHGVDEKQLRVARRHLSTSAAHISALLRSPTTYRDGTGEQ